MSAQVYPIASRPPEFPCWLWAVSGVAPNKWIYHRDFPWEPNHFTHWHPDSATPPTVVPGEDRAIAAPTKADPTSLLTSSERLHEAIAVMLRDWKDGDFQLPELARIHMENVREKYQDVGKALKFGEESFEKFQREILEPALQQTEPTAPWLDAETDNPAGIKAVRERYKMTQAEFGDYIGVRQATVSDWENGKVEISRLGRLAITALIWRKRAEGEADAFLSLSRHAPSPQTAAPMCSCCAGTGKPVSGLKCVCGGAGTQEAELQGFRESHYNLSREIERLKEAQTAGLPDAITAFEYQRLRDWFSDPKRKPSHLAFTAGAARDAASAFEMSQVGNHGLPQEVKEAMKRLEQDAMTCEFVKDAVHYYGSDKDQLAADLRLLLAQVGKGVGK